MSSQRIHAAFAAARAEGRAALMPYFTVGFPDFDASVAVLRSIIEAGADLIELGIPFSDPLADGPTIQHASQIALNKGMTLTKSLKLVQKLRIYSATPPLIMMSYTNPILAYGVERLVADAAEAGADGLIVPDLPLEEAATFEQACNTHDLALIYLAAPTTTSGRLTEIARRTNGFLYLVSLTGVTGERAALPADLATFVRRARSAAHTPLAVGFGISNPEQARLVGELADGVIVGSALIRAVAQAADPAQAAHDFVSRLRGALTAAGDPGSRAG
ncbi:MAG: Tryptophan synthase alpha chain [Chloroflexi bacterium ADurb.Bin325]|nr:MAG: Tryptophan synthase alpha chain [Chloroflexi bacterium ADurb.Bin325]